MILDHNLTNISFGSTMIGKQGKWNGNGEGRGVVKEGAMSKEVVD